MYMVCPKFWAGYCLLIYAHHQELIKSAGNHGSSLLLFMTEGNGLTLCEQLSQDYYSTYFMFTFKSAVEISQQTHLYTFKCEKKY